MTQTCAFVHISLEIQRSVAQFKTQRKYTMPFTLSVVCISSLHICQHRRVHSQRTHEGRARCRGAEGRSVSFFFFFLPPSLPVSNQDKSSTSKVVLPF